MMNLKHYMNEYGKDIRKNEMTRQKWINRQTIHICISTYIHVFVRMLYARFISICKSKCRFRYVDISTCMYACIPLYFCIHV